MLTAKSVHMALSGAPCVFTWLRYFGNQPSRPPWCSVREEPAMAVMIDRIRVKNSSTIRILVMNSPPLTMLARARPMSDPA